MSYDLHLFVPPPGADLLAAGEASFGNEQPDAPTPETDARKEALAAALLSHDPMLRRFEIPFAAIAEADGITVEEARAEWRDVELGVPGDEGAVNLVLSDHTGYVMVPYWHTGREAEVVWRRIWGYLALLERQAGYRAYDPQRGEVLDLAADRDDVIAGYVLTVEHTRRAFAQTHAPRRPWWRFW